MPFSFAGIFTLLVYKMKEGDTMKIKAKSRSIVLASAFLILFLVCISSTASASTIPITFVTKWGSSGTANGQFLGPIGVAVDSSGNVYVTDSHNNRIQKFDSNGTFITKWGSNGSADGQFGNQSYIALDSSDNVYVADYYNHRIQKFDSNGTFITKWGSPGSEDGQFNSPGGIVVDSSDNVYVVEHGNHRIQKFDSNGTFITKWGSNGSADGQFLLPNGVAVDSSDNVYVSDISNSRVQKFDSNGTFITKWGSSGIADGQFRNPYGIAVDSSDNVYVSDISNSRVQKFDSNGTFITKWGSSGIADGQFRNPIGVAVDSSDNVYVADYINHRIQKFASASTVPKTFVTKWGSSGTANGQFRDPSGVAVDSLDNVYVVEQGNYRIQKFDNNGTFITKWGSPGIADGQFNNPIDIAIDSLDNVYVADSYNKRIQKFDSSGTFITKWGSNGSADGQFWHSIGVAVDSSDNVYVADYNDNRVQKFDSNGTFITKWGSKGIADGQFRNPIGVAVDSLDNVYVSDASNQRIQKFDNNGTFITKWGSYGIADGQFIGLYGIAFDSSDNVYVVEHANTRVQKFDNNGTFITKWGYSGSADGQFLLPADAAVDSSDNVYISDRGNSRIQKFAVETAKKTPTIIWNNPADIISGTALSSTQFNAIATDPSTGDSIPGTFIYKPPEGTVLNVGTHILHVDFVPENIEAYNIVSVEVQINVIKATPSITWNSPADIAFGTALSSTQLSASASVPGNFTYNSAAGTILGVGTHTLQTTFTPTDSTNYTTASDTVSLTVNKATPVITWNNPVAITYGTLLSETQLNVVCPITAGSFEYNPPNGTVLGAGTSTLNTTFTPNDSTNYTTATADVSLTVNKEAPTITWNTPDSITYGTALSNTQLNASASIPGTFTYTPGNGTILSEGTKTLHVDFTPTDTANYSNAPKDVTINVIAPPVINSIAVPIDPVHVNNSITASANVTYLGDLNSLTAEWNWGDQSTTLQTQVTSNLEISHVYNTPGIYTVSLTVKDPAGGTISQTATDYIVVYDPNGGFVTGGGWINSPAGAYVADTTLGGKASFGFVSKYGKGATVPTGKTEFQFKVANLNFHSENYDWLVVAGSQAKFKGTGTINGQGNYGFMLSAADGTIDKFRIKIWNKDIESNNTIYDNEIGTAEDAEPTTVIGGGSIIVHTEKKF